MVPGNIEKLGEDRWFAEEHWYGIWGGDDDQRKVVARNLIREIARRRQAGVPGVIQVDRAGNVTFVEFN
jgi:hypothetical protein